MATRITKTQLQDEVEALRSTVEQQRVRIESLLQDGRVLREERDGLRVELRDTLRDTVRAEARALGVKPRAAEPCDAHEERIELSNERIVTTYWKGDKRYQKVQIGFNRFAHREVR